MINVSTNENGAVYNVRLSGSLVNILLVGIIDYLQKHKVARGIAAVIGITCLVLGGIAYVIPDWIFDKLSPPLFILGGLLSFSSVLAGDKFVLLVGDAPEVVERKEAEEHIKDTKDPYASLDCKRSTNHRVAQQSLI